MSEKLTLDQKGAQLRRNIILSGSDKLGVKIIKFNDFLCCQTYEEDIIEIMEKQKKINQKYGGIISDENKLATLTEFWSWKHSIINYFSSASNYRNFIISLRDCNYRDEQDRKINRYIEEHKENMERFNKLYDLLV